MNFNITENILHVGADKPFDFLHITDTHLAFADERDGKRKKELSERRLSRFPKAYECLKYYFE